MGGPRYLKKENGGEKP